MDAFRRERERERVDRFRHRYEDIISIENLLVSWQEFLRGKRKRTDVVSFSLQLMDNIVELHHNLREKTYRHGSYHHFKLTDPKPRDIHKAAVRDRLVHHAIHRWLYSYFDRLFIHDSYSCRIDKGTHRALNRLRSFGRKVSHNDTRTAWVLQCDITKFFATIDHEILKTLLWSHIEDGDILWLLDQIIGSFHTQNKANVGLPLGNLTSQLLINVYMNELDQFMKRRLKLRYYLRYADDFLILHESKSYLLDVIPKISTFLNTALNLSLHQDKVSIKTLASGVDFLGWVHFPDHRVLRTTTKRRIVRRLEQNPTDEALASYLGLLSHGNTQKLVRQIVLRFSRDVLWFSLQ